MIAILAVVGAVVWVQVDQMTELQTRVITLRMPAIEASQTLRGGLNRSLAALRGFLLTGKEAFKTDRAAAWTEVKAALKAMGELSQHFTNQQNIERYQEAAKLLGELSAAQQSAEAIARTPDDLPATKLLNEEAAPAATQMVDRLTAMIDAEKKLPATPERKALLASLADARASAAGSLAALRGFLAGADPALQDGFRTKMATNGKSTEAVAAAAALLEADQAEAFHAYQTARTNFEPLAERVFAIRTSEDWNQALKTLVKECAPRAARIDTILGELIDSQHELIQADSVQLDAAARDVRLAIVFGCLLGALIGVVIAYFAARGVTRPAYALLGLAKAMAEGDLSREVSVKNRDEMGDLAGALTEATAKMRSAMQQISANTVQLAGSSNELDAVSQQMSATAEETSAQASSTAAAAEQVTRNVETVATGAEEMSASVREIAKNASDAARVATSAVTAAEASNKLVAKLGESSNEIGQVIKVITSIAEQTNLLALNATIEAARAGEAGKGFAVVANEVKELAKQTAQATDDISHRIESIQNDTRETVSSIAEITRVINQVNDIATMIASAVEEQSATTSEIGQNVTEAAKATSEIATNATGVAEVAQSTSAGAQQTQSAAAELARMSSELQALVQRFRLEPSSGASSSS